MRILIVEDEAKVANALRAGLSEAQFEVRVADTGVPEAHRARIFDRFYRVDEGRSRDSGGVGLGLAIARWAIEANRGTIALESDDGKGCLFRIVLPATPG